MHYQNIDKVDEYLVDPYKDRIIEGPRRPQKIVNKTNFNYQQIDYSKAFADLGHSSIFIKLNNYHLLIDPVFSQCCGPYNLIGTKRFDKPQLKASSFPLIDAILITHNHYDHLDLATLKELDQQTKYYIVPLGIRHFLINAGFKASHIKELNWYETTTIDKLTISCLPSHHNSNRYLFDHNRTLWCSYLIGLDGTTIYHSGDTAFSSHFETIKKQIKQPNLVFMECGQYNSHWHHMHMFPEESIRACQILGGQLNVPIHWGAYCLSPHAYNEPTIRYEKRAKEVELSYLIPNLYEVYQFH